MTQRHCDPDNENTDFDDPTNNYGACQWTLVFGPDSDYDGSSITVAGREADIGTSLVAIIGGTGRFTGATGVMATTPEPQGGGDGGVLFRQELMISTRLSGITCDDDDDDSDSDDEN